MQSPRPTIGIYQPLLQFGSDFGMSHLRRHAQFSPLRFVPAFQPLIARRKALFCPTPLVQMQHYLLTAERLLPINRIVELPDISFDPDVPPAPVIASNGDMESAEPALPAAMAPEIFPSGMSQSGSNPSAQILSDIAESSSEISPQAKILFSAAHSPSQVLEAFHAPSSRATLFDDTPTLDDNPLQPVEARVKGNPLSPSIAPVPKSSTQASGTSKKSTQRKSAPNSPTGTPKPKKTAQKGTKRSKKAGNLPGAEAIAPVSSQEVSEFPASPLLPNANTDPDHSTPTPAVEPSAHSDPLDPDPQTLIPDPDHSALTPAVEPFAHSDPQTNPDHPTLTSAVEPSAHSDPQTNPDHPAAIPTVEPFADSDPQIQHGARASTDYLESVEAVSLIQQAEIHQVEDIETVGQAIAPIPGNAPSQAENGRTQWIEKIPLASQLPFLNPDPVSAAKPSRRSTAAAQQKRSQKHSSKLSKQAPESIPKQFSEASNILNVSNISDISDAASSESSLDTPEKTVAPVVEPSGEASAPILDTPSPNAESIETESIELDVPAVLPQQTLDSDSVSAAKPSRRSTATSQRRSPKSEKTFSNIPNSLPEKLNQASFEVPSDFSDQSEQMDTEVPQVVWAEHQRAAQNDDAKSLEPGQATVVPPALRQLPAEENSIAPTPSGVDQPQAALTEHSAELPESRLEVQPSKSLDEASMIQIAEGMDSKAVSETLTAEVFSDPSSTLPMISPDPEISPSPQGQSLQSQSLQDQSLQGQSLQGQEAALVQGFSIGGSVAQRQTPTGKPIAPSDTVPAMLTPGEFIVNAQDAQKHLPLLQHLNQGGGLDDAPLPPVQEPPIDSGNPIGIASPPAPLSRKSKGIQRQQGQSAQPTSQITGTASRDSSSSLSGFVPLQSSAWEETEPENAIAYSPPPIIHRSPGHSSPSSSSSAARTLPQQWSSVEDLLGTQTAIRDESSPSADLVAAMDIPAIVHPAVQGFAEGGEVHSPTSITKSITTETITADGKGGNEHENQEKNAEIEDLAQEIYVRLKFRLEIERERQGLYKGRLPW